MRRIKTLWITAGVLGAFLAVSGAQGALADTDSDIDVNVDIPPSTGGVLALTVDGTSTALAENGSTALMRQFTGTLPTVTVTDTRDPATIDGEAFWSVLGTLSDFTGDAGQPPITADHVGWTPQLIDGGAQGLVAEGDPVDTVLDSGPDAVGLVDQELLFSTANSSAVRDEGSWTATASLVLRTQPSVAAGKYHATLTLSLFE